MVFQLLYASAAAPGVGPAEVDQIIADSIRHNGPVGITGMLLCADGAFVQLLEGDEEQVRQTVTRISPDPRHQGFHPLFERHEPTRACPCWSMGVQKLSRCYDNRTVFAIRDSILETGKPVRETETIAALLRRVLRISAGERVFL